MGDKSKWGLTLRKMEADSTWSIWWLSIGSSLRLQMMPLVMGWLWGRTGASMALPDLYLTVKTLPMGDAASSSLLSSPLVKWRLSRSSTIFHSVKLINFYRISIHHNTLLRINFPIVLWISIRDLLIELCLTQCLLFNINCITSIIFGLIESNCIEWNSTNWNLMKFCWYLA